MCKSFKTLCSDVTHERLVVLLCWMRDRTTFDYHLCFEQLIWPIDFDHRTGPKHPKLIYSGDRSVFWSPYFLERTLRGSLWKIAYILLDNDVFFFSLWTCVETWPSPHKFNSIAINEFQFFSARVPVYVYMNAQPHYNHSAKVCIIPDF